MKPHDILNLLIDEPEAAYHGQTRRGEYLSSHLLADFRRCPAFYHRKLLGQVPDKRSAAYDLGRAAHKLILEGNAAFDEAYLVSDGPLNPKTQQPYGRTTKAYADWLEGQDREIISTADRDYLEHLRSAVMANVEATNLLKTGVCESVVRAPIAGEPCHIRMDWFNPEMGIVDLKTAADLDFFEHDIRRYGYVLQMAFYRSVLREATGFEAPVYIIGVEKAEPFRAGVWFIFPDVLDEAEKVNLAAIKRLRECRASGQWETGFEAPRAIVSL